MTEENTNNLAKGYLLGHYRIGRKLGAGGMGEVYLAEDTQLDRKVAIKFLNEEFSRDADKLSRFIQEAKAASALNHPNILTVHEIGEADGKNYIVTEFIEGETLRERLSSKESISLSAVLKIGVQVAEALAAAHKAGIVHRDIKPENIMIRADGYAKVLDFGLAKLTEKRRGNAWTQGRGEEVETLIAASPFPRVSASPKTDPGMVMGTAAYMSPEQARGKEIDERTDIWSLGAVLYEMLSGKVPFAGETINHTIVSILEKEPVLLENVPDELQRIVRKALTKDKEMRYQTARDLLIDLKNLRRTLDIQGGLERSVVPQRETANTDQARENETQIYKQKSNEDTKPGVETNRTQNVTNSSSLEYAVTQAGNHKFAVMLCGIVLLGAISAAYFGFFAGKNAGQINSIAVLPFENRSGNADLEYLSDGLAESLIYRLSQLPDFKVSPTSSVFRYKGKEADAKSVADELGVDAVMTGRIMQRGDNLAISVELIDVRNNKLLWGEQYERKMSELLQTQREIASEITGKLRLKLSGEGEQKLAKKYTENPEAYNLYLKGRFYFAKRNPQDLQKAIEYFNQTVALDPNFALGYAGLADAYSSLPNYRAAAPREAMPKAKDAALKALSQDNTIAEAHAAIAFILQFYDYDFAGAEREYLRAVELNPNYAQAHHLYGILLSNLGRYEECFARIGRALELDPLSLVINRTYGERLILARRPDEAVAQLKKTIELDAGFLSAHYSLATAYQVKGSYGDAVEEFAQYEALGGEAQTASLMRDSYARNGWQGFMRLVADKSLRFNSPWDSPATVYVALGEKDKAFAELNKSYENRENIMTLIKVDPRLDPLRDDPRFKDLIKKVGFPN